MANVFAITAAVDRIALGASRRARTSFTVSNMAGRSLATRARAVPVRPDAGGWFTVAEPEREIMIGETRQFTVDIVVPRETPAGEYVFRLDVAGIENPDEEFAQGPGVVVVVPEPELVPRRFPWWLIAAGGAALLIVIVVVVLLLRDGDGEATVMREGTAEIAGGDVFDFDRGEAGNSTTADIELVMVAVNNEAIRLINAAQAAVLGPDPPGFDGCRSADFSSASILMSDLDIGNHLCIRTSEGNVAEVRIDNTRVFLSFPPRFGTVDMTFATFEDG